MSIRRPIQRLSESTWAPLVALLLIGLLAGALLGGDYGMSWDEERNYTVGADALQAILNPHRYRDYLAHGDPLAHHGPSFFMVYALASRGLVLLNPNWHIADARHLVNFLAFLAGVAAFYALALRLTHRHGAWMAAALLATQPLLFGHAFINQKDTPFLAFFLISVAIGLYAVDRAVSLPGRTSEAVPVSGGEAARNAWQNAGRVRRILAASYLLIGLLLLIDLVSPSWRQARLAAMTQALSLGIAWAPLQALANSLRSAGEAKPNDFFVVATWLHDIVRVILVIAWFVLAPFVARWTLPGFAWRENRPSLGWFVLAGAVLGFTISIRQIGAFAGLLILIYWLRRGGKGLWLLGVYALVAGITTYATWPYLWAEPLQRFWVSLVTGAEFEIHMTPYRGEWVFSDRLPWHYFPTLAGLELTLPAVVLFLAGLVVAARRWSRRTIDRAVVEIVGIWIFIPLLGLIGFGLSAYNNIRQLHFVLAPMLLLAGVALDALMRASRRRWLQAVLLAVILIPGIAGIVRLHPYEYTYFNVLTGGTMGAEGRYGLDYWCTSYREAMAYVNEVAAPGDQVMVMGPLRPAMAFARSDLEILRNEGDRDVAGVDYLLTCYRWLGQDWGERANLERIHTLGPGSVVFAEVFRKADDESGCSDRCYQGD